MEIRPINLKDDLDEIFYLLKVSLNFTGDRRWFEWKHVLNPFGASVGYVAMERGSILGVRLLMQWQFSFNNEVLLAWRPVDTVTHPASRGKGIFKGLTEYALNAVAKESDRFIFNTPNGNSKPGYLKMGWRELPTTFSFIYFLLNPFVCSKKVNYFREINDQFIYALNDFPIEGIQTLKTTDFIRWRYSLPQYQFAVLEEDGCNCLIFQVKRTKFGNLLLVKDYIGHPRHLSLIIQSAGKYSNALVAHALDSGMIKLLKKSIYFKRGHSSIVFYGDDRYFFSKWGFSGGDIEATM